MSGQRPATPLAESWAYLPMSERRGRGRDVDRPGVRPIRWVVAATVWMVLGAGAGILASVSVPLLFGYRTFIVMSGSMEPAIHTGDLVVDRTIPPEDARVGDVVTYRDPYHPNRLITHRVRGVEASGDHVNFVTKGDANNDSQKWAVARAGSVGVVRFRMVKLGYVLFYMSRPIGRLFLIVVPIVLLSANEIVLIWRKDPEEKESRVVVSA